MIIGMGRLPHLQPTDQLTIRILRVWLFILEETLWCRPRLQMDIGLLLSLTQIPGINVMPQSSWHRMGQQIWSQWSATITPGCHDAAPCDGSSIINMRRIIFIILGIAILAVFYGPPLWDYYKLAKSHEESRMSLAVQTLCGKLSAYNDKNHRYPHSMDELSFTNEIEVRALPDIRKMIYKSPDNGIICVITYRGFWG